VNRPGHTAPSAEEGLEGGVSGGAGRRRLRLSEHTHAGHIYGSREEQLDITAAFFRASLGERLRCVYVHDDSDDTAALHGLTRAGLDVSVAVESAALQLADRSQLPAKPGEFSVDAVMRFIAEQVRDAQAAGYEGVRGVGDMGWVLLPDPNLEQLAVYETKCTAAMNAVAVAAICQYDRSRFDESTLFDMICAHPCLIIAGTLCENPYYVPEASFEDRERGSLDIDHALGNVLARERQERWLAVAEVELEADSADPRSVDLARLASIYEHMRDYKLALRDRVRWRMELRPHESSARAELAALEREVEWLDRRASLWRRRELQSSGLLYDPVTLTMGYRGRAVGLSRLEAALLRVLLDQAARPCSAAQLSRSAWGRETGTEAQLRNYILRLRTKLEMLAVPASIVTIRGRGYCLTREVLSGDP